MIYAHIVENRCIGISQLYQVVNDADLIPLKTYDLNILGMKYDRVTCEFSKFDDGISFSETVNVSETEK